MRLFCFFAAAALFAVKAAGMEIANAPEAVRPLPAGAVAPTARLDAIDGSNVDLASVFAAKPTILIFYRGGWCPFCNRHLAALANSELELRQLGYQIVAVSPDPISVLSQTAVRRHLRYRLLSDRDLKASADYQVVFRISAADEKDYRANGINLPPIPGQADYWLPIPTAFVVGRDGRIKFVYSNPDPSVTISTDALLAAAKSALATTP
jgi:peroxiredoxin